MNENELEAKEKLEEEGWKVLHSGPPDFLCLKTNGGGIESVKFVEVKNKDNGKLRYEQKLWKKALRRIGADYDVMWI